MSRLARVSSKIRRGLSIAFVVGCFALVPVPTWAQSDPPGVTPDSKEASPLTAHDLRPLLRKLESGSLAERDAAERELLAKGPAILHLLPQLDGALSPELKQRLERVVSKLKQKQIELVTRGSRLTLSGSHPLDQLIRQIESQTGNRLVLPEDFDASRKIEVDWQKDPFWPCIDQMLDQADLMVDTLEGKHGELRLLPRPPGIIGRFGLADYQGAFRFEATRVQGQRNLRVPAQSSLQIHVETIWEPRLAPIAISYPFSQFSIEIEEGEPITPNSAGAEPVFPIRPDMLSIDLVIGFPLPPRTVEEIKVVRGRCDVLLPARVERLEFADLEKSRGKKQRKGQLTVSFIDVRKNDELYELVVEIEFDRAESAFQSHLGWMLDNPAHIIDRQGKKLEALGMHTMGRTARSIRLAYLFELADSLDTYRFVYQSPTGIIKKPVEFELYNVELP